MSEGWEKKNAGNVRKPFPALLIIRPEKGLVSARRAGTQNVNNDKQEQPDDIDKMPIPCSRLETEMLLR